jgi:hypothetical protein
MNALMLTLTLLASTSTPAANDALDAAPWVRIELGARVFQRSLSWRDDVLKQLPSYQLPLGPAATLDVELYPLAHLTQSALTGLGVVSSFEQSLGINSKGPDGEAYETTAMRFRVGAQFVLPFSRLSLRATAGWSMRSFGLSSVSVTGVPKVNLPNVRYGAVRAGLGLGLRLAGPLSFELGAAYQFVLDEGELSSAAYFARAKAAGADFTVAFRLRVLTNVELSLGAEYERFWVSLYPEPGDPWVAGGALDDYRSLTLRLGWVWP